VPGHRPNPEPPSAQSPFAPSRHSLSRDGINHCHLDGHDPTVFAPTGSCAGPNPSPRLPPRRRRWVFAGCCQPLLGDGPSRRYLCEPVPGCLDLCRVGSWGCACPFLPPRSSAFPASRRVGFPAGSAQRLQSGIAFRGCSHSVMFRPPGLLATRVAPTAVARPRGSCDVYVRAEHGSLPSRASDMLAVRNRAIDGMGTCTPQDSQPCRLLPRRSNPPGKCPPHVIARRAAGPTKQSPGERYLRKSPPRLEKVPSAGGIASAPLRAASQ